MQKSAFALSVEGETWCYKPTLHLIPNRCSTNVCWQPKRRQWCFRRRERRVGRARLIWDAVSRVLGLKLKPGVSETVTGRTNLVGWLEADYQSPWAELLIWDFNQKVVGVSECVGAHLGCASVRSGCVEERIVLRWMGLGAGESLWGNCRQLGGGKQGPESQQ